MEPVHLTAADCVFVMIDIQEKLVPALSGGEKAVFEASRLLRCAQEMKIPLLTTEQYPKGLGPTVGPLRPFIDENALFAKTSFSCFEADGFAEKRYEYTPSSGLAARESWYASLSLPLPCW